MQRRPFRFLCNDHAAWLGMLPAYADPETVPGKLEFAKDLHGLNSPENLNTESLARRLGLFRDLITGELIATSMNPLTVLKAYLQEDTIYGTKAYDRETHHSAWKIRLKLLRGIMIQANLPHF